MPILNLHGFPGELLNRKAPTRLLRSSSLKHLTQDHQGALPSKLSLREILRLRLEEELGPRLAGNSLQVCESGARPISPRTAQKERLTLSASASLQNASYGLLESVDITCDSSPHTRFKRCDSVPDHVDFQELKNPLRDRVFEMIPALLAAEYDAHLACAVASGLHFATEDSAPQLLEDLPAAVAEAIVDLALEKVVEAAEMAAGKTYTFSETPETGPSLVLSSAVGHGVQEEARKLSTALHCCKPKKDGDPAGEELAQQKLAECLSEVSRPALACYFQGKLGPKSATGTLLFWAQAFKCRTEVLQLLTQHHADPNARYNVWPSGTGGGYVSLPLVAYPFNTTDYVMTLLGANADVNLSGVFNYFPQGNPLFQACWFRRENLVDFLLAHKADACTFGWNADSPPLGSNVESDGTSALAVAARSGMSQAVRDLLDHGADAQQCLSDVFESAHEDILCLIAKAMTKKNPRKLLDASLICDVHHRILTTLYKHIVDDVEAAGNMQKWLMESEEAKQPDFQKQLMEFSQLLITDAPEAAAVVMDGMLLINPKVTNVTRNPLPLQCVLDPADRLNTAYVTDMEWEADPKCWPWQETFLQQGRLMTSLPFVSWSLPKQLNADDSRVAPSLQKITDSEFCEVDVLFLQNAVEGRIFNAIKKLSYTDKADLLDRSLAMRAIVSYAWTTWGYSWHMAGIIRAFAEMICVLLWWFAHVELDNRVISVMGCWTVYTAITAQDILVKLSTSFILKPAFDYEVSSVRELLYINLQPRVALENVKMIIPNIWRNWNTGRELHTFLRVSLCISGYRSWHNTVIDAITKEVLAVIAGLSLLGILGKMRKFHEPGHSLLPIFNIMQSSAMQYMVVIFFVFLTSAFLFVLVHLEDYGDGAYGAQEKLVRIWQTFAVGESSVFAMGENPGDGGYSDPIWLYLVMCVLFFAINIMTLNILINVSGEAYSEQLDRIRGSLFAERFGPCWEVSLRTSFYKRRTAAQRCSPVVSLGIVPGLFLGASLSLLLVFAERGRDSYAPLGMSLISALITLSLLTVIRMRVWLYDHRVNTDKSSMWLWICHEKTASNFRNEQEEAVEYPSIVYVMGAGEECVNGQFHKEGERNGRPMYHHRRKGDLRIYWNAEQSEWRLHSLQVRNGQALYKLRGADLPLSTGSQAWEAVSGSTPTPDVLLPADFSALQMEELRCKVLALEAKHSAVRASDDVVARLLHELGAHPARRPEELGQLHGPPQDTLLPDGWQSQVAKQPLAPPPEQAPEPLDARTLQLSPQNAAEEIRQASAAVQSSTAGTAAQQRAKLALQRLAEASPNAPESPVKGGREASLAKQAIAESPSREDRAPGSSTAGTHEAMSPERKKPALTRSTRSPPDDRQLELLPQSAASALHQASAAMRSPAGEAARQKAKQALQALAEGHEEANASSCGRPSSSAPLHESSSNRAPLKVSPDPNESGKFSRIMPME